MDVDTPMASSHGKSSLKRPVIVIIGVSLLILILLVQGIFFWENWLHVFTRALRESWLLVFERTAAGVFILALAWIMTICIQHRALWRSKFKLEVGKVISSLQVPIYLFLLVFFVHLLIITPATIYREARRNHDIIVAELEKLKTWHETQSSKPLHVEVKTTTADEEARTQLEQTRKELLAAYERIELLSRRLNSGRSMTELERKSLTECLAGITSKGEVWISPEFFDSETRACASELEALFRDAGFEATSQPGGASSPYIDIITWGFTGERILVLNPDVLPPHAKPIQDCFSKVGRSLGVLPDGGKLFRNPASNLVVIAVGARP